MDFRILVIRHSLSIPTRPPRHNITLEAPTLRQHRGIHQTNPRPPISTLMAPPTRPSTAIIRLIQLASRHRRVTLPRRRHHRCSSRGTPMDISNPSMSVTIIPGRHSSKDTTVDNIFLKIHLHKYFTCVMGMCVEDVCDEDV